ncbi:Hypothetical protein HDN1F_18350 [gamma proteobacterium HdN1]|nr:Hypothetical protein HDN1F_18350 [gamma proteobacterium HdN1]
MGIMAIKKIMALGGLVVLAGCASYPDLSPELEKFNQQKNLGNLQKQLDQLPFYVNKTRAQQLSQISAPIAGSAAAIAASSATVGSGAAAFALDTVFYGSTEFPFVKGEIEYPKELEPKAQDVIKKWADVVPMRTHRVDFSGQRRTLNYAGRDTEEWATWKARRDEIARDMAAEGVAYWPGVNIYYGCLNSTPTLNGKPVEFPELKVCGEEIMQSQATATGN